MQQDMSCFVKERKPELIISLIKQAELKQRFVRGQPMSSAAHTQVREFPYKYDSHTHRPTFFDHCRAGL